MTAYRWAAMAVVGGLGAVALSSCATLNQEQCLAGDWSGIGYTDGTSGYGPGRLSAHQEACARHGVSPDPVAWDRGRQRGLVVYCTPENGFRVGMQGGRSTGVCPRELEAAFSYGIEDGLLVHAAVNRVNDLVRIRDEADQRARQIEVEIRREEDRLGDSALSDAERDAVRERLRRLRRDRDRALDDSRDVGPELRWAEAEVDNLRSRFRRQYGSW